MTKAQLAAIRRISVASADRLIRRQGWRKHPGNDGRARVLVPRTWAEPRHSGPTDELQTEPTDKSGRPTDGFAVRPTDALPDPTDKTLVISVLQAAVEAQSKRADRAPSRASGTGRGTARAGPGRSAGGARAAGQRCGADADCAGGGRGGPSGRAQPGRAGRGGERRGARPGRHTARQARRGAGRTAAGTPGRRSGPATRERGGRRDRGVAPSRCRAAREWALGEAQTSVAGGVSDRPGELART